MSALTLPDAIRTDPSAVAFLAVLERFDALPVEKVLVWHVAHDASDALAHVAETLGLSGIDFASGPPAELIARAIGLMRACGTAGALKVAIEALGYAPELIELTENPQLYYDGSIQYDGTYRYGADTGPFHFDVEIDVDDAERPTVAELRELWLLIETWSRASTQFTLVITVGGELRVIYRSVPTTPIPDAPADPAPELLTTTPVTEDGGSSTWTGTHFAADAVGEVDGASCTTTYVSDTELTVEIPAGLSVGLHDCEVVQASGSSGVVDEALEVTASGMSEADALAWIEARALSLCLLVDQDYDPDYAYRLLGHASAGSSAAKNYDRLAHSFMVGTGGDVADATVAEVAGKQRLVFEADSAGVVTNTAQSTSYTRTLVFGAASANCQIIVAFSAAVLAGSTPQTTRCVFGSAYYGLQVTVAADGRLGLVTLNEAASTYQYACLPAGTVAAGEDCIVTIQRDGTGKLARVRKGLGAWSAWQACEVHSSNQATCVGDKTFSGGVFEGTLGAVLVEQSLAADADVDTTIEAVSLLTGYPT